MLASHGELPDKHFDMMSHSSMEKSVLVKAEAFCKVCALLTSGSIGMPYLLQVPQKQQPVGCLKCLCSKTTHLSCKSWRLHWETGVQWYYASYSPSHIAHGDRDPIKGRAGGDSEEPQAINSSDPIGLEIQCKLSAETPWKHSPQTHASQNLPYSTGDQKE